MVNIIRKWLLWMPFYDFFWWGGVSAKKWPKPHTLRSISGNRIMRDIVESLFGVKVHDDSP